MGSTFFWPMDMDPLGSSGLISYSYPLHIYIYIYDDDDDDDDVG